MPKNGSRPKIAIACQGGGSQTAFTAGVLKALVDRQANRDFELVGISGTSGGAVCAALLWFGFWKGDTPLWRRLVDFWTDNTARGWAEETFNQTIIDTLRLVNRGMFPVFQLSPANPLVQAAVWFAALGSRPVFTDFHAALRKHIDFDEIAAWGARSERPVLIIGAANVTTGKLAKFVSRNEIIRLEHILASCAVPNIFPAVRIGEHAYWDGLFSDNPPVEELIRPRSVGTENVPEEIWLIKINPTACRSIPEQVDTILDRRNQMEGNISLFHQLDHLEMLNDMIMAGAFRPTFLKQFDVRAPIRIPKSFSNDPDKAYHIPCIEMPEEALERLDYEGKIDRSTNNIEMLMSLGKKSVDTFFARRALTISANPDLTSQIGHN